MNLPVETLESASAVATAVADALARCLQIRVAQSGVGLLALSGGRTPEPMLMKLSAAKLPWERIHVFQVDERVVPRESVQRNWAMIERALLKRVALPASNLHPMPVDQSDLEAACGSYAALLRTLAGPSIQLDCVHLGLGEDGHTASLLPADPILKQTQPVALSGPYQGSPRMSLTFPVLNSARRVVWEIVGEDKRSALEKLVGGDLAIPASRIETGNARVFTDILLSRG